MKKFGYTTVMQVPRIKKITLNMGVGESVNDKKVLDHAVADMTRIAGQKPVVTKTRKSIANFKVRAGYPVGCMVTLRGARMYEFLDRLVNIAIPRIRDFRGVSNRAFDGRGSYSLGRQGTDHFPRDRVRQDRRAARAWTSPSTPRRRTDDEARALLTAFRFPFKHGPGEAGADQAGTEHARTERLTTMAKLSVKLRDKKRRKTVEKFKAKRAALFEVIHDAKAADEDRDAARAKLQRLPRDASPVRGCATAAR